MDNDIEEVAIMGIILDAWIIIIGVIIGVLLMLAPILLPIAWGVDIWTRIHK